MDFSPSILGLPISSDHLKKRLAFGQGSNLSIFIFSKTVGTSVSAPVPAPHGPTQRGKCRLNFQSSAGQGDSSEPMAEAEDPERLGWAAFQSFWGERGGWTGRLTEGVFLMSLERVFGKADMEP